MRQVLLSLFVFLFSFANAQSSKNHTNLDKKDRAIKGYDAVSYFNDSEPSKGNPKFSTVYQGVEYLFVNSNNKETFLLTPNRYAPQYGGWCAYAMGLNGSKVGIDPETFKIIDDKLYLFYNAFFNNTLPTWNEDEVNLMKKANDNWKTIISK